MQIKMRDPSWQLQLESDAANFARFTVSSSGDLTINPTGGDTSVTGTFSVAGQTTLAGGINGDTTLNGHITVGNSLGGSAGAALRVLGSSTTIRGGSSANILLWANGTSRSDVTSSFDAFRSTIQLADGASITQMSGIRIAGHTIGTGSAVTNAYGAYVEGQNAGTNNYAFYTNATLAANGWAFYGAGTASSFFGGAVTVGRGLTIGSITSTNNYLEFEKTEASGESNNPRIMSVSDTHAGTSVDLAYVARSTSGGHIWYTQTITERMRLQDGALLLGTTVATNSTAGDVVIANARALRGVNAAGTNTFSLIQLDASNQCALGSRVVANGRTGAWLGSDVDSASGGNGTTILSGTAPADASAITVRCWGQTANGTGNNAYFEAQGAVVGGNIVWRTVQDLNSTNGGNNQGFALSYTAGLAFQIVNKSAMSYNQQGIARADYF
jgi:hypothetical protein